jgi:hypothetical protein
LRIVGACHWISFSVPPPPRCVGAAAEAPAEGVTAAPGVLIPGNDGAADAPVPDPAVGLADSLPHAARIAPIAEAVRPSATARRMKSRRL